MELTLEKAIHEISIRMRLFRAMQEDASGTESLSEREAMLLELLDSHSSMTISEITEANPNFSPSTVSTAVTRLWRNKKMVTKTIQPDNQRVTVVELTDKGKKALEVFREQRSERFRALFHAIGVTDEERRVFLKILTRATKYLDKYLEIEHKIIKHEY